MGDTDHEQADELLSQIERLGELKEKGLISEEEFAAQKAKWLNPAAAHRPSLQALWLSLAAAAILLTVVGTAYLFHIRWPQGASRINRNESASEATPGATSAASAAIQNSPPVNSRSLDQVFNSDAIGENTKYLETLTGPPFSTEAGPGGAMSQIIFHYRLNGCKIVVGSSSGKIDNIGLENFGGNCVFDIGRYFHDDMGKDGVAREVVTASPTFGNLSNELGGNFTSDCLALCGNSADPTVSLMFDGAHSDNFNQLVATINIYQDGPIKAWIKWGSKLNEKYGPEYTASPDWSKDNLNDVAQDLFKSYRPTEVRVGLKLFAE